MTETITSKYSLFFWAKILLGIIFEGFIVFLVFQEGIKNSIPEKLITANNLMFILIVLIAGVIVTLLFPPKSVIVSADLVVFRSYITQKKRKITYPDIDKIRTVRKQKFIRGGDEINYQQLELVLINGDVYAFNEDDYDNYESLKAAIYDHKFRGQ
ncbi:hypothetical protein [Mucilaginibacter sp. L196]|uniref:hypothetical protein n=1 Tax=Mucilaginibacter sp. L196 TaxID=1641870 RepID=UPI00131CF624|nr:hypothetical protein [Mucilaginibacter sp. L196]